MADISRSSHPTRATRVTFFEDRAQVERRVTLSLEAGTHAIELSGITRFIDDTSLSVGLRAEDDSPLPEPFKLLAAKVQRRLLTTRQGDEAQLEALAARHRAATHTRSALQRERERLELETQRLRAFEDTLLSQLQLAPTGEQAQAEHWRHALTQLDDRLQENLQKKRHTERELRENQRELDRAHALREQALTQSSDLVALVEAQLSLPEATTLTLTLTYVTPCALWRPSHRARLVKSTDEKTTYTIQFETQATVWQRTGERWEQVECAFSTARPAQSASPPLLSDDLLFSRPKTDLERQVVHVTARDETISQAGTRGPRQVEEMPGVDDGGEPLVFHAADKVDLPSSKDASTLPLFAVELPARVDVVAFPELQPVAHLRARTTWRHATYPLLAGPVTLLREQELAGLAPVKFVSPGEPFELGFGAESSLRIKREVEREEIPKKLSRKRHEKRTVTLYVSNLSERRHDLHLVERIPVSELEQVQIALLESEGARPDQDGMITLDVGLGPNQHTKHTIAYELELDPKVRLDF